MLYQNLYKIIINNLKVFCVIGTLNKERTRKQKLILNIEMNVNGDDIEKYDDISATVDYHELSKKIISFVKRSQFYLIETLALNIAQLCLQESSKIKQIKVRIDKPSAIKNADSAAVEVIKEQS